MIAMPSQFRINAERVDAASARPTLLLVDDEERILRSLRMLFAVDYRVLICTSGHEALEILQREKVHVLVSDQRMPLMNGVDLLRQARDCSPNTMRLLLTGYADLEAVIGSINEGEVFRYLNKPWEVEEIRRIVGEAMEIAVGLDAVPVAPVVVRASADVEHIMLLDHDAEVAIAIRGLLEEASPGAYRLVWVKTQDEAMFALEQHRFSVLISEIRISGEDLTPFLTTLKRFHPQLVSIVLTSFQDTSLLMELINQGQIHRFLPKPLRKTLTLRGIQSGVEQHREVTNRPELARRHSVEIPRSEINPTLIGRIRGLFRGGRGIDSANA